MKPRITSIALLSAALSWTVFAQGPSPMREGNWEITMKMNMGGMEMPATKQMQCVTAAMIKDPQGALPKGPGADCKVVDYKLAGATATYKMTCTQPTEMTIVGEMKYASSDAYTGTVNVEAGGMAMAMSFDPKRVGECAK